MFGARLELLAGLEPCLPKYARFIIVYKRLDLGHK